MRQCRAKQEQRLALRESRDWSVEMPTWLRRIAPRVEMCLGIAGTPEITTER
jgi:hypothetical protein